LLHELIGKIKRPLKEEETESKERIVTLLETEREQLIKDVLPSLA